MFLSEEIDSCPCGMREASVQAQASLKNSAGKWAQRCPVHRNLGLTSAPGTCLLETWRRFRRPVTCYTAEIRDAFSDFMNLGFGYRVNSSSRPSNSAALTWALARVGYVGFHEPRIWIPCQSIVQYPLIDPASMRGTCTSGVCRIS